MDTPSQSDVPPRLIRVYVEDINISHLAITVAGFPTIWLFNVRATGEITFANFPCPAHLEGWPHFLLKRITCALTS